MNQLFNFVNKQRRTQYGTSAMSTGYQEGKNLTDVHLKKTLKDHKLETEYCSSTKMYPRILRRCVSPLAGFVLDADESDGVLTCFLMNLPPLPLACLSGLDVIPQSRETDRVRSRDLRVR